MDSRKLKKKTTKPRPTRQMTEKRNRQMVKKTKRLFKGVFRTTCKAELETLTQMFTCSVGIRQKPKKDAEDILMHVEYYTSGPRE